MTAAGLRERKKLEVRDRLCAEAMLLFAKEPADDVSIDRIAFAANVSRATFFNYFPSKSALLDELTRRMTERLHRYLTPIREKGAPLHETLLAWFAVSVETIRRSESLSRLLFGRALASASESELRASQMAEVHAAYAEILVDARARGEVGEHADVALYAEMIAGSMTMLLSNWWNDASYPLEARAEQVASFLATAIVNANPPSKGRPHAPRKR